MQYIYNVQFCVAASGVVVSPLIPQEMHCFKLEFCVWFLQHFSGK